MPRQRRNSAESTRCLFARGSESKNKQSSPRHALWGLSGAGYGGGRVIVAGVNDSKQQRSHTGLGRSVRWHWRGEKLLERNHFKKNNEKNPSA